MGRKFYTIGAGSPLKPTVILIQSTFDYIQKAGPEGMAEVEMAPIPAAAVATDLIMSWCGDHPGNRAGKRGVGIIRGQIVTADGDSPPIAGLGTSWTVRPTDDEVNFLARVQTAYLQWLVDRADEYHSSRNPVDAIKISSEHREALQILNLDEKQHPWYRSKSVIHYSRCPNCAQMVLQDAIFCQYCRQSVLEYFLTYDITPSPEEWPNVCLLMEKAKAKGLEAKKPKGNKEN
jgi:hypothetical protein